jgi:uncharacterized Zn finger protein (UPF0148 family)
VQTAAVVDVTTPEDEPADHACSCIDCGQSFERTGDEVFCPSCQAVQAEEDAAFFVRRRHYVLERVEQALYWEEIEAGVLEKLRPLIEEHSERILEVGIDRWLQRISAARDPEEDEPERERVYLDLDAFFTEEELDSWARANGRSAFSFSQVERVLWATDLRIKLGVQKPVHVDRTRIPAARTENGRKLRDVAIWLAERGMGAKGGTGLCLNRTFVAEISQLLHGDEGLTPDQARHAAETAGFLVRMPWKAKALFGLPTISVFQLVVVAKTSSSQATMRGLWRRHGPVSFEEALQALRRVGKVRLRGPTGAYACCPAHDDKNPSLTIREASNPRLGFVAHCHAGCVQDDVFEAILDLVSTVEETPRSAGAESGAGRSRCPHNRHMSDHRER